MMSNNDIWQPNPGKQTEAYNSLADELLVIGYGGGKTDLLLGLAYTQHTKSLIMRRKPISLRGIIERSKQMYTNPAFSYNESLCLWSGDLPVKRIIEFQSCVDEYRLYRFHGRAKDFVGFDGVNEFTEYQYHSIKSCNRNSDKYGTKVVSTMQAIDKDDWTYEYWSAWLDDTRADKALYGELRWFATLDCKFVEVENGLPIVSKNNSIYYPKSRTVISMTLPDNPHLNNPDYVKRLEQLPEPLRSQMLGINP